MDELRLFRILLFFSANGLLYIYLGLRILIRNKGTYSRYIAGFYFTQSVIFIINIIYAFIFIESIVYILYLVLLFVGCIGFGFLTIFVGMLFIQNKDYFSKRKTRNNYILLYANLLIHFLHISQTLILN